MSATLLGAFIALVLAVLALTGITTIAALTLLAWAVAIFAGGVVLDAVISRTA